MTSYYQPRKRERGEREGERGGKREGERGRKRGRVRVGERGRERGRVRERNREGYYYKTPSKHNLCLFAISKQYHLQINVSYSL